MSRPFRVAALLLAAATLTFPSSLEAQRDAPASLVASARAVTREVAALRDLPVLEPVDFRVSDRETIREFARASLDREMPPERWGAYEALLEHTGLIPPTTDLHELILSLYTEQIAGYYDPARKTFYLADWLPELLQRAVVAHEVTHALQDQHFDLERWLAELPPTEDGALARAAVAEGDAMAAMLAYVLVPTGASLDDLPGVGELLRRNAGAAGAAFPTFDRAPKALQRLLLFPYVEGADFVLAVRERGGWDAVDRLYREPPASTEQILHPERYWNGSDPPRSIDLPSGAPSETTRMSGSWGEFGVALVLEAALGDSLAAREAARGWAGDRYALSRAEDGTRVYRWSLAWDSTGAAERFAEAYAQATVSRFPGPARYVTGEGRFEFDHPVRTLELVWSGDRVEIFEKHAR
ncbi:MAG: hypothetical protein R3326_05315 [Gemmatimonadota bacterium]|nr:hypothetical protein [Gemmatimonadota bacterium]